jgi:uncharacterized RDD family membrane protein YckC
MHTLFLLLRRSASFLYDCLLLIAVFFIFTTVLVLANDGEDVAHPLFYVGLWGIAGCFFTGFWKHGGQTLGMRAWNLRLIHIDSTSDITDANSAHASDNSASATPQTARLITSQQVWKRYLSGSVLFGISYLWSFIDNEGLSAHDRISNTRIIKDSKHLRNKT